MTGFVFFLSLYSLGVCCFPDTPVPQGHAVCCFSISEWFRAIWGDGGASAFRETQNPPSGVPVSQPAGLLGLKSSLVLPELVAEKSSSEPGRPGREGGGEGRGWEP